MNLFKDVSALIILWFIICVMALSLTGCSRKTPVDNAFQEVQTSIVAIKDSLPPECQTAEVMAKIDEVEWKRQTAESVCQAKIKDTEVKYERLWWVIIFVVLAFTAKFFIKR